MEKTRVSTCIVMIIITTTIILYSIKIPENINILYLNIFNILLLLTFIIASIKINHCYYKKNILIGASIILATEIVKLFLPTTNKISMLTIVGLIIIMKGFNQKRK